MSMSTQQVMVGFDYDDYVAADAAAHREGSSIYQELVKFLQSRTKPDYLSSTPQPGDTVLRTENDWGAFRADILGGAAKCPLANI